MSDYEYMGEQLGTIHTALNKMLTRWYDHDLPADFLPERAYPFDVALEDLTATVGAAVELLENPEAVAFLKQNTDFAKGLTYSEMETVIGYAEHHSGNLMVLVRDLGDGWHVKAHDSWGPGKPDEEGDIIVHVYNGDAEDPGETVTYFETGKEAIAAFRAVEDRVTPEPARNYLTLGELREATRHLPDDMPITSGGVVGKDSDWFNVHLPSRVPTAYDPSGETSDDMSLILELSDDFDTRQW